MHLETSHSFQRVSKVPRRKRGGQILRSTPHRFARKSPRVVLHSGQILERRMLRPFNPLFARLDARYREHSYFTGIKARLLAVLCTLILVWLPFNIVKLLWIQPPDVPRRVMLNVVLFGAAVASLRWIFRGRIERAGDGLALGLILPTHAATLFAPAYYEPLSLAIQLFAFDLIFLLVSLIFASRRVTWLVVAIIVVSHFGFHYTALSHEPIAGSLAFAANTLLRDGLIAAAFAFVLGITLVLMIETAHRRSEQALRETQSLNENLERLVAERTRELETASQRAHESSRAKGEFLANMSHEIRTPLNGIIASSDLLRQRHDLPPEVAEHMRLIGDSGDLLLRLLGDILDFSKIEAG